MNLKQIKNLADELAITIKDKTIITGGHFLIDSEGEPTLNKGTISSFQLAAKIYCNALQQNKNVDLGLLINDIGTNCTEEVCEIKKSSFRRANFTPMVHENILSVAGIDPSLLHIYWEKHIRNRASLEIKRRQLTLQRKDITKDHIGYWLMDKDSPTKYLLTRNKLHSPYGLPACPLIMAAYFMYQEKQGYQSSMNIWYIAEDNSKNIPNHFLIEKGAHVAKAFGSKIIIQNVYLTKDGVMLGSS
ncbi:hypothetical protein EXS71_01960 [Candidatus Uhrbacteria bacterium]|nr:hypothetical protein [Candidatus Uhrbacteria bacterium]